MSHSLSGWAGWPDFASMEKYNPGEELLRSVNVYLEEGGMQASRGKLVDATIINAPGWTRNQAKQRDPGMKAHTGVDSEENSVVVV
jgi:hypothetical protein